MLCIAVGASGSGVLLSLCVSGVFYGTPIWRRALSKSAAFSTDLLLGFLWRPCPLSPWLRLNHFVALAAQVTNGFGFGEASAVQQLIEERQRGEGEDGEDEEEQDDEAGNVPAIVEGIDLLDQSRAAGHVHTAERPINTVSYRGGR